MTEHPTAGEVIFADDAGLVFAERWCWRQSDQSAARADTTDVVITVEAQHENARGAIEAALADLLNSAGKLRRRTRHLSHSRRAAVQRYQTSETDLSRPSATLPTRGGLGDQRDEWRTTWTPLSYEERGRG